MKITCSVVALMAMIALDGHARAASAALAIEHVPLARTAPYKPLEIAVDLPASADAALELHYRGAGGERWQALPFGRQKATRHVATIAAEQVTPPGVEYFIVAVDRGAGEVAVFGSDEQPHAVVVDEDPAVLRRARVLASHQGRRAEIEARVDYVDYAPAGSVDRYVRFESSVGYLLLAAPVKMLRFGYTEQRGQLGDRETRFRGGWSEATLSLRDGVEFDARALFLVNDDGFDLGGRGEVRVGIERGPAGEVEPPLARRPPWRKLIGVAALVACATASTLWIALPRAQPPAIVSSDDVDASVDDVPVDDRPGDDDPPVVDASPVPDRRGDHIEDHTAADADAGPQEQTGPPPTIGPPERHEPPARSEPPQHDKPPARKSVRRSKSTRAPTTPSTPAPDCTNPGAPAAREPRATWHAGCGRNGDAAALYEKLGLEARSQADKIRLLELAREQYRTDGNYGRIKLVQRRIDDLRLAR